MKPADVGAVRANEAGIDDLLVRQCGLDGERASENLTWEERDSRAAQAYQD